MTPVAHGRIVLWEGASLWVMDVPPRAAGRSTDVHAHHAIQFVFALEGHFELSGGGGRVRGPAAAVAADAPHAFTAQGVVALLFIDPETSLGQSLARNLFGAGTLTAVPPDVMSEPAVGLLAAFRDPATDEAALRELGRAFVARLGGAQALEPDPRVRAVVDWAPAQIDRPVGVADAPRLVGLSRNRMSNRFVDQTDLPFRP